MSQKDLDRFRSYMGQPTNTACCLWQGACFKSGYGKFWLNGRTLRAHRAHWELVNGEIPEGLLVLHTCDVPACVNLAHLFLGTFKDNEQDKMSKGRKPAPFAKCPEKQPRGTRHGMAKLSGQDVLDIRANFRQGLDSFDVYAAKYGVDRSRIWQIVKGKGWNCLGVDKPIF